MNVIKILIFVLLLLVDKFDTAGKHTRLIYESDVSEHCRRRVVPSIFLGRQVMAANSRVIQFSRLELPYSCFISVRTEAGSSIVMMVQVSESKKLMQEACQKGDQLLVYEMGETFGGYWGAWPETVLNRKSPPQRIYTLKTTQTTTTPQPSTIEEEETETTQTSTSGKLSSSESQEDYMEVEVPLVNVSVHFVPDEKMDILQMPNTNTVDTFDLRNDVTPIEGVAYDRSMLPLVQFQLVEQPGAARRDDGAHEPLNYGLDFLQDFTPDIRLTLPQLSLSSKRRKKTRYQSTKRLNFKKHRTLFNSQRYHDRHVLPESITRRMNFATTYIFPTTRNVTNYKLKYTHDSWQLIEDLIKKLNKTKAKVFKTTLSIKETQLLENVSDGDHNKSEQTSVPQAAPEYDACASHRSPAARRRRKKEPSMVSMNALVYLSSNLFLYDNNNDSSKYFTNDDVLPSWTPVLNTILNATEKTSNEKIVLMNETEMKSTTILEDMTISQYKNHNEEISSSKELSTKNVLEEGKTNERGSSAGVISQISSITSQANVFSQSIDAHPNKSTETTTHKSSSFESFTDTKSKMSTIATGLMVGHESWENVVQAAPEMAVLLNQTVADVISNASDDINKEINEVNRNKTSDRKKRNIHSIAIENAKPHNRTTHEPTATTTELSFDIADMQEFAELVELQDDEVHGRIALRNLQNYVGPALFNLCDVMEDDTSRPLYLFNSSRIVLAPSNFTFNRIKIILTAARALLSGEVRCPKAKIECQVSGARVCMDSMVSCDNVPNCGSSDVYDEDNLRCGQKDQQNVYLAAFTTLAVLLTIIYAVHYWLKRCIPKVADAFFVYSNGVENVLYLETIMRSPHDTEEGTDRMVYHRNLYEGIDYEGVKQPHKNVCLRLIRKLCCCCRKSKNKDPLEGMESLQMLSVSKRYSFAEQEIRKMIHRSKDIAVQTGASLEIRPLEYPKVMKTVTDTKQPIKPKLTAHDLSIKVTDSLLTLEEPLPEDHIDDLSLLKFLKELRIRRGSSLYPLWNQTENEQKEPPRKSPDQPDNQSPDRNTQESGTGTDSLSEKEIEVHTYNRNAVSEPGPSKTNKDIKDQTPSPNRHLRFNEVATTIPAGRYTEDEENAIRNVEGRRVVASTDRKRHGSRLLDTIIEDDEQGSSSKEQRNFWGKAKKIKKKTRITLR